MGDLERDEPTVGAALFVAWLFSCVGGGCVLLTVGGKRLLEEGWPGDWLAFPAAICVGLVVTKILRMKGRL